MSGWTVVAALVVLPAAFVAGLQFPLLISLLGRGREKVGAHVGLAYAWNTAGAIVGSLAGGFGLLPILSATGTWVFVTLLLSALALAALAVSRGRREETRVRWWLPLGAAAAGVALVSMTGPTAAWRHSPIGAGRVNLSKASPNRVQEWLRDQRRRIFWEADGVESSVAMTTTGGGLAFVVNGKIDGNTRTDAPTQVMSGLIGAALHGEPRRALVIGLGTGSTAGWLAEVPSIERVDVVELEPAILHVARGLRAGQSQRAGESQGACHDPRRARVPADLEGQLRRHLLRALEPLPRRHLEPLHRGLLQGRARASVPGRHLPPVAAVVRGGLRDRPLGLRDAPGGLPVHRELVLAIP